ncbi:MAG: hypothetical protein Q7S56_02935, partial [Nanoarchaeota archaeon]|nr:hypothetical protein [Nanoarchaeota archaeon]
ALRSLGFNRTEVGTIPYEPWKGNPGRPRIWRFPETSSMVNYIGLEDVGAEQVAKNLSKYGSHNIPIRINVMATPGKTGKAALDDIASTIRATRDLHMVDEDVINISCPNTEHNLDKKKAFRSDLEDYLYVARNEIRSYQRLGAKISPDTSEEECEIIIDTGIKYGISFIIATNTTKLHLPQYINKSPGVGGASGAAVYDLSLKVQRMFETKLDEVDKEGRIKIVAVGGIDSAEKFIERTTQTKARKVGVIYPTEDLRERQRSPRVEEIQIYTGFIFRGPKLLQELRRVA